MTEKEEKKGKIKKRKRLILRHEFFELTKSEKDLTEGDFNGFFEKQYQEFLVDQSKYLKDSNKVLSEDERNAFDGERMSQNPQGRRIKLELELQKLGLKISNKEEELKDLTTEESIKIALRQLSRLSNLRDENLNKIEKIDLDKKDCDFETAGVTLTKQTFIETKLDELPKKISAVIDPVLFQTISNYRIFLANKLSQFVGRQGIITNLTHRHEAIIYKYKADAKCIPDVFNRTEIRNQFGKGREKGIDTIWNKNGRNYRKADEDELNLIIPHLLEYPLAQLLAKNDLSKIKSNL